MYIYIYTYIYIYIMFVDLVWALTVVSYSRAAALN